MASNLKKRGGGGKNGEGAAAAPAAGKQETTYTPDIGLAFSGGGIRSCSFSSGLLCAMLQKDEKNLRGVDERKAEGNNPSANSIPKGLPKYISCVSGGGYLGSSFLSYCRSSSESPKQWADKYFANMRQRVGYYVSFERGVKEGIFDIFLFAVNIGFLASIGVFIAIPFAIFNAITLDYFVGDKLRGFGLLLLEGNGKEQYDLYTTCFMACVVLVIVRAVCQAYKVPDEDPDQQPQRADNRGKKSEEKLPTRAEAEQINAKRPEEESDDKSPDKKQPITMFAETCNAGIFLLNVGVSIIVTVALIFHMRVNFGKSGEVRALMGVIFGIVFHRLGEQIWSSVYSGVPVSLGYFVAIVFMAEFSVDHIYYRIAPPELEFWGIFNRYGDSLLHLAALAGLLQPMMYFMSKYLLPSYSITRLVNAFYHPDWQASSIWCKNMLKRFPKLQTVRGRKEDFNRTNSNEIPTYIACTTANAWKTNVAVADLNFAMEDRTKNSFIDIFAFSTDRTCQRFEEGVDARKRSSNFTNGTVPLPYIMGLSAAAVALQNGDYQSLFQQLGVSELLLMLGLNMGGFIAMQRNNVVLILITQAIIQVVFYIPLLYSFYLPKESRSFFVSVTVLTQAASFALNPLLDICSLRAIEYLPGGLHFRILTKFVAWSVTPPPVLYLSDGGHTENLGLLPLLARRLPFIIIADGSTDTDPVSGLKVALQQARNKLPVTFHACDWDQKRRMGDDVKDDRTWELENDLDLFGRQLSKNKNRAFMFHAHYDTFNAYKEPGCSSSTIIYLRPNPFEPNESCPHRTEDHSGKEDKLADTNLECACHRSCCRLKTLSFVCGTFPDVSTTNQFFTPMLWEKFHQQGFAAGAEAINILGKHGEQAYPFPCQK